MYAVYITTNKGKFYVGKSGLIHEKPATPTLIYTESGAKTKVTLLKRRQVNSPQSQLKVYEKKIYVYMKDINEIGYEYVNR